MKEVKTLYLVTIVIRYVEPDKIQNPKMQINKEKTTIYSGLQKLVTNEHDAYQKTLIECQRKFEKVLPVAHSILLITKDLFDLNPEEQAEMKKIQDAEKTAEEEDLK